VFGHPGVAGGQHRASHRDLVAVEIRSDPSGLRTFGQIHECPDSENDADQKQEHKYKQEVLQSRRHCGKRSVGIPKIQHICPSYVWDAVAGSSNSKVFMLYGVVGVDLISGFPDQNDSQEKTDQAHGVEGGHEGLGCLVSSQDEKENHHETDHGSRGGYDCHPFDEIVDRVVESQKSLGIFV
jgi:hypothetical protein